MNTYTSAKGASQTDQSGMENRVRYDPIGGSFDFSNFNFYLNAFDLEKGY